MDIDELLLKLLSFKSLSYEENELVEWLECYLESKGLNVEVDRFDPGNYINDYDGSETANLYLDLGSGKNPLLLYAHTDVVDAEEEMFNPELSNGIIHGRGTADMKSSLAALAKFAEDYNGDQRVIIHFIADEETSGTGARAAIENLRMKEFETLECILMEPTNNFEFVENEGKGYGFYRFKGSFGKLWKIASELNNLEFDERHQELGKNLITPTKIEIEEPKENFQTYEGTSAHASTPGEGRNSLTDLLDQKNDVRVAWTPKNSRNVIPPETNYVEGKPIDVEATLFVDVRTIFGSHDKVIEKVEEIAADIGQKNVDKYLDDVGRPYSTPPDSKLVKTCRKAVPEIAVKSSKGGSDAGYYAEVADNVVGGLGPGEREVIHTDNEFVKLSELERSVKIIQKIVEIYSDI